MARAALSRAALAAARRPDARGRDTLTIDPKSARWAGVLAWSLFAAGLALRLLGLPFNGQHDLDQMVVDWGGAVHEYGLGHVFLRNYGVFSYVVFGAAFQLAEHVPRFWWAPYKLFEIAAEILILIALRQLLPPGRRHWALVLYWINPWFVLHGAWQGFWDGPHTLDALAAVLCARRVRDERTAWLLVGACLMSAGMFKPQGLVYFIVPVGLYVLFRSIRERSAAVAWYAMGVALVLAFAAGLLLVQGGSLMAIPLGYVSASTAMPNLCNGCLSVWRPIAGTVLALLGQEGPTWALKLPRVVLTALNTAALVGVLTLIGVFAWKAAKRARSEARAGADALGTLQVLAFASLAIPQLGTSAHINHTYAALVLLIPFALANRRIAVAWAVMTATHFYSHLVTYGLGQNAVVPTYPTTVAFARALIARMEPASHAGLLAFQGGANRLIADVLPHEPWIMVLSAANLVCTLVILRELFAGRGGGGGPAAAGPPPDRKTS